MKQIYFCTVLVFYLCLLSVACRQKLSYQSGTKTSIDTIQYSVLRFDTSIHWVYKNVKPDTLNFEEISLLEMLLTKAAKQHNDSTNLNSFKLMPLTDYKMQFFPIVNEKGEKEVWVNCLCHTFDDRWRRELVGVEDGGNCYFNIKVNLTKQSYSQLYINGEA